MKTIIRQEKGGRSRRLGRNVSAFAGAFVERKTARGYDWLHRAWMRTLHLVRIHRFSVRNWRDILQHGLRFRHAAHE